jgi:hypothetical protein
MGGHNRPNGEQNDSSSNPEVVHDDYLPNSENEKAYSPSEPLVLLDQELEGLENASRLGRSSVST